MGIAVQLSQGGVIHFPGRRDMEVPLTQEAHQFAGTEGPAAVEEAGKALRRVIGHDGPLAQRIHGDFVSLLGKAVVPVAHQVGLRPVELHRMLEPVQVAGDRLPFAVFIFVAERALPKLLPHSLVAGNDGPKYGCSQLSLQPKLAADSLVQRLMQLEHAQEAAVVERILGDKVAGLHICFGHDPKGQYIFFAGAKVQFHGNCDGRHRFPSFLYGDGLYYARIADPIGENTIPDSSEEVMLNRP